MNKIKVLFLAANPEDTPKLDLDEQFRLIEEKIRVSDYRDSIELKAGWAVRSKNLLLLLNRHYPHIVHFSGHGTKTHKILLVGSNGKSHPISENAIKALFSTLKYNIKIVILDACYTRPQAEAIVEEIDCAIGMNSAVEQEAATIFTASFYQAIGFRHSIQKAFEQGIVALKLENIAEENIPELICKRGIDPSKIFLLDADDTDISARLKDLTDIQLQEVMDWKTLREKFQDLSLKLIIVQGIISSYLDDDDSVLVDLEYHWREQCNFRICQYSEISNIIRSYEVKNKIKEVNDNTQWLTRLKDLATKIDNIVDQCVNPNNLKDYMESLKFYLSSLERINGFVVEYLDQQLNIKISELKTIFERLKIKMSNFEHLKIKVSQLETIFDDLTAILKC